MPTRASVTSMRMQKSDFESVTAEPGSKSIEVGNILNELIKLSQRSPGHRGVNADDENRGRIKRKQLKRQPARRATTNN